MNSSANSTASDADEQPIPGARLAEEMRLLLDAFAARAEPWLDRFTAANAGDHTEHTPPACGWCPLCAGAALLRGERSELAARLAEQTLTLLTALRAALADHECATSHATDSEQAENAESVPTAGRVQRITINRHDS